MVASDGNVETVLGSSSEGILEHPTHPTRPLLHAAQPGRPTSLQIEVLSATSDWVELLVPCELEVAALVSDFLDQLGSDLPKDTRTQVGHAFRELLTNAIEWGGSLDPNQKVRISYLRGRRILLYRIADPGRGFCFGDLKHAAVTNPPGDVYTHIDERNRRGLRPGGLGILMVKAMADELLYNEAQNEVVFIKYLAK